MRQLPSTSIHAFAGVASLKLADFGRGLLQIEGIHAFAGVASLKLDRQRAVLDRARAVSTPLQAWPH